MRIYPLVAIFSLLLFSNCSSTDEETHISSDFMPVRMGNYWKYDVFGDVMALQKDSLYILDKFQSNRDYITVYNSSSYGFYTSLINNCNMIYRSNGKTRLYGLIDIQVCENFGFLVNSNLVFFNDSAELGEVIGFEQETNVRLNSYDSGTDEINGDYTMKTELDEVLQTYTAPNGNTYNDVKVVKFTLNMRIYNLQYSDNETITDLYLDNQDVIVSRLYFAKGIGLVYANTTKEIHFETQYENLPMDYSGSQEEVLTSHRVIQ